MVITWKPNAFNSSTYGRITTFFSILYCETIFWPEDCLAIEDTEESSNSAVSAGIKCIGFPGDYHLEDSFQMCIKKMNLLDQSIFSL